MTSISCWETTNLTAPALQFSTNVLLGTIWLCTRGCAMAVSRSSPKSMSLQSSRPCQVSHMNRAAPLPFPIQHMYDLICHNVSCRTGLLQYQSCRCLKRVITNDYPSNSNSSSSRVHHVTGIKDRSEVPPEEGLDEGRDDAGPPTCADDRP